MSVPQWNADIITPDNAGDATKVLDSNQVVQPTLEGGSNITIAEGVISADSGTTYTEGTGIDITDGEISVTSTIADGAAAGATAVQPGDLSSVATSGAYSDLSGTPTVDQTYDSSSTNAQSGVAVASAVSGVKAVPTVESGDDGLVLKATYSGGVGSYSWGTDDDTTYSAGNGIDINSSNQISVTVSELTTAGITDIQQVNALPATPVATVLYLIPST